MVNKYISVTTGVTEDDLEGMSTKGYDFWWRVCTDGYEWADKDSLAFSKDFDEGMFQNQAASRGSRYDKDCLFGLISLIGTTSRVPPKAIDTQAPWIVAKGDLALTLKQNLEKTSFKERKVLPTRRYELLSIRTLHRRFASLNTENLETAVLIFANKYGLLGQPVPLEPPPRLGVACVEGESLYRWRSEIEKMGVLLAIWDLIRHRKAGKLGQFILRRCNPDYVRVRLKWRYQEKQYEISEWDGKEKVAGFGHIDQQIAGPQWFTDFFNDYEVGDVIGPAWFFLRGEISCHLDGIRPKLVGPHEPEVTYVPRTLLDALWLLFMLEVQGKTKTARCEYCGEWFELERSSKKYCNGNCRRLACYHRKTSK